MPFRWLGLFSIICILSSSFLFYFILWIRLFVSFQDHRLGIRLEVLKLFVERALFCSQYIMSWCMFGIAVDCQIITYLTIYSQIMLDNLMIASVLGPKEPKSAVFVKII